MVWNVPRLAELPTLHEKPNTPFVLYYHGSINRERLPESVLEAVASFDGAIRLDVAGYEAPGAQGYIAGLLSRWNRGGRMTMQFLGEHQHHELLTMATRSNAGLALMPMDSKDVNMKHMVGASNKVFDYMAAGLPLIVSDLPDWRLAYVDTGYGMTCDPASVESVKSVLNWLIQNPEHARCTSARCRGAIEREWNYERQFQSVISHLS
ncbi:MAG TPA: hypothetical protein DDY37_07525 [Legionella sp.]|nr:hypothetical protein [Legionella sp.]